jgi:hypothetical protein
VTRQESAPWRSDRCTAPSPVECERAWSQEAAPYLVWMVGLALFCGLSACGPTPSDPAPNMESDASLTQSSVAHEGPQSSSPFRHGPTEPTSSLSSLTSSQVRVSDPKKEPARKPDHKEMLESPSGRSGISDQSNVSGDGVEKLGFLPMMIEQHWAVAPQVEPPGEDEGQEAQLGDDEGQEGRERQAGDDEQGEMWAGG